MFYPLLFLVHHPTYLDIPVRFLCTVYIFVHFCRKIMYGVKPQILESGMSNVEDCPDFRSLICTADNRSTIERNRNPGTILGYWSRLLATIRGGIRITIRPSHLPNY